MTAAAAAAVAASPVSSAATASVSASAAAAAAVGSVGHLCCCSVGEVVVARARGGWVDRRRSMDGNLPGFRRWWGPWRVAVLLLGLPVLLAGLGWTEPHDLWSFFLARSCCAPVRSTSWACLVGGASGSICFCLGCQGSFSIRFCLVQGTAGNHQWSVLFDYQPWPCRTQNRNDLEQCAIRDRVASV